MLLPVLLESQAAISLLPAQVSWTSSRTGASGPSWLLTPFFSPRRTEETVAPSGAQGPGVILGAAQTLPRPPVHPQDGPGGKVGVGWGCMRKPTCKNPGEGRGQGTFIFLPRRERQSTEQKLGL